MSSAVLLLSGGMDSAVLLAWARQKYDNVHALSFDYGSKHAVKELECAKNLCERYNAGFVKIDIPFINSMFNSTLLSSGGSIPDGNYAEVNMSSTVVPFRNGIMLSVAIGYAENHKISDVLLAVHAGDHQVYPDCRPDFVNAINQAAQAGTYTGVRVLAPFVNLSKKEIAAMGKDLRVDFTMTWSCYKGLEKHCGKCPTCIERKAALGFNSEAEANMYLE